MYENADLFNEEMERIFKRTWVWVAHDSELADKARSNCRMSASNRSLSSVTARAM